jgi:hypothetical protein
LNSKGSEAVVSVTEVSVTSDVAVCPATPLKTVCSVVSALPLLHPETKKAKASTRLKTFSLFIAIPLPCDYTEGELN